MTTGGEHTHQALDSSMRRQAKVNSKQARAAACYPTRGSSGYSQTLRSHACILVACTTLFTASRICSPPYFQFPILSLIGSTGSSTWSTLLPGPFCMISSVLSAYHPCSHPQFLHTFIEIAKPPPWRACQLFLALTHKISLLLQVPGLSHEATSASIQRLSQCHRKSPQHRVRRLLSGRSCVKTKTILAHGQNHFGLFEKLTRTQIHQSTGGVMERHCSSLTLQRSTTSETTLQNNARRTNKWPTN